jgi:hypothetical protein
MDALTLSPANRAERGLAVDDRQNKPIRRRCLKRPSRLVTNAEAKKKRRRENHNESDRAPVPGAAIGRPFPPVFVPCRGTVAGAMSLSYGRELLYFDESPSIEMQVRAILDNRQSLRKFPVVFCSCKSLRYNMLC